MSEDLKNELNVAVEESDNTSESFHEAKATTADIKIPFSVKKDLFFSKEAPPKPPKEKPFFWSPPGRSKYEKKLVFKLDVLILTYCCLSFFVKYLDVSNISNAYVSGMKEDFGMHGNQYNWLAASFSLIYAICGFPGTILMTKIKPHILLPSVELVWAFLTLITICTSNYRGILAVRIIQGAFEGLSYPSINYILGSWYTKQELTKRTAIFGCSGTLGTMFGGYIQSGVYDALKGHGGLKSWKWAFVIDALITLPVAVVGFFMLPDTPADAKPGYFLSEEDIKFCQKRIAMEEDSLTETNKFDWSLVKRGFSSWQFFVFPLAYALGQIGEYVSGYWGIALKAEGYSVYQSNNLPTIASGISIVVCAIVSVWCDYKKSFWEAYTIVNLVWIFSFSVLVAWDVPPKLKFFAFCFSKLNETTAAVICSWANNNLREDRQLRAFVLGALNVCYCCFYTPIPLTVWNTDYAPRYKEAHAVHLGLQCASTVMTVVVVAFDRYQKRKLAYIDRQLKGQGEVIVEEKATSEA